MLGKYLLVLSVHFVCTALVLKVLNFILPCCITCIYSCTGNFLMFLLVSGITFRLTKKKHLNERLQPENRAVLITGCDSGFGFLLAKHLDSLGFHVFASCLDPEGAGAAELAKSKSNRLQTLGLDVRDEESVRKALEVVKENLGTSELWAIVNNAGIHKGFDVELTSIDDFRECMEVNALGPVRVTKAFLPLLRQSRGRVVNLISILGRIAGPYATTYCMSKFACAGFNDCLRQEMDVWGIRVISVEPELFETPLTKDGRIGQCVEDTFQSLDNNVRADYGDKYLKNFRIYAEYHTGLSSPKVRRVISALEDAVSNEHPDLVYRPCRNSLVEHLLNLYEVMPHIVKDTVTKFILFVTGFPRPQEANFFSSG